ncbi:hypothetical protein GTH52_12215 [Clostridium tyrobutyricum]|uniref:hypothetical protein n=1 Tax=Clostridium tyrobutyricum TaxID=1519 RepID=UPI00037C61A0|nr:hypothetical protein [Clostridium tyrobutyricum]MBR9648173.1 transposase [Clostridium tyrobutyricum]MBV4422991.1 transposase [Clostridium tyrobutyricum]MBV4435521.1 transposase [Clostridium tyrobutyricum]MBV4438195.1 transposase [Clostridium tyrobutyricum]MBV4447219.1 transposase [Clostridium tyrobutyricum]
MSEKKETKKRHNYTTEFKNQIVELYHNGKMKSEIARCKFITSKLTLHIKSSFFIHCNYQYIIYNKSIQKF